MRASKKSHPRRDREAGAGGWIRRRRIALLVSLLIVVVAAIVLLQPRDRRAPALTAQEYRRLGVAALDTSLERSIHWYQEGVRHYPDHALLHYSLAIQSNNLSYDVRLKRGRLVPGLGSSRERVAAARRAVIEMEHAARLDPAQPRFQHDLGMMYGSWGFIAEALSSFQRAHNLRDTTGTMQGAGRELLARQLGVPIRARNVR